MTGILVLYLPDIEDIKEDDLDKSDVITHVITINRHG